MMLKRGFTLIELLIVVAIIAILAAIAVPNFLEAQTRAKVSRIKADQRSIATAIEAYRVDNNSYPLGTDNPTKYPQKIGDFLGALAPGFYSFQTRDTGGLAVGRDFHGLTTPVSFITTIPGDPFTKHHAGFLTYAYRPAKDKKNGWILTSVGPDVDLLAAGGVGTSNTNALGTAADGNSPARLGDINERQVIHYMEGTAGDPALIRTLLEDLTYDSTNGTKSDGDIWRIGGF